MDIVPLKKEYKQKIVRLIKALFPQATVYLFGSRARGTHDERSDIDLAIDVGEKLPHIRIGEMRSILQASHIPYSIDVVDLYGVSETMRNLILEEGIIWTHS